MNETNEHKTLLHACCGPCSLEPSRILREQGCTIDIFYANSNIDPCDEYAHRLEVLGTWATDEGIRVIEGPYRHGDWLEATRRAAREHPGVREERCRACYRLRMQQTAAYAAEKGYREIATTLSVSPYQYTDVIREELERAAGLYGIGARFEDFRPFYDEATRISRERGMYRQNYCGCEISRIEAQRERDERKAARAAEREAYLAEHAAEIAEQEAKRLANRKEKSDYAAKRARQRALLKAYRDQAR